VIVDQIEQRLGRTGVRYTTGRRAVVAAMQLSDGPKSASELHETIDGSVPLSTLYRTLAVLEEAGVAVPHFGVKGITRYELAEWITGHHHHLVCTECGAVDDIDIPDGVEAEIRRLVDLIADDSGFIPSSHELEIEGRCGRCA
jgi:Fe2+ or Zn2+ uptake regulation protein